jgi:hypothetical protein
VKITTYLEKADIPFTTTSRQPPASRATFCMCMENEVGLFHDIFLYLKRPTCFLFPQQTGLIA